MRYPLDKVQVVADGQFGTDPSVYAQFGMIGHNGVDLVASIGTPVYAPEDSDVYVSSNGTRDQYTGSTVAGELVVLKGTMEHWLLHLSKRLVTVLQHVKEGQLIGYSGDTGFVTGPHLHWGLRPLSPTISNGYRGFIDPMKYTQKEDEMIDTDDKARDVLWAVLHQPGNTVTAEAIASIKGQPYSAVIPALVGYSKWKDQNDKLVAYKRLKDAVDALQDALNKKSDANVQATIQDVIDKLQPLVTNK